ncbi:hypothetical protein OG196_00585 [Kitasatospora purpeofusca]|uniref:hypothetical protein n=1 Tax=Kitasatospora purpeofusca TaxID=67352 RepID=UPI002E14C85C|nr:hypothetical protein OG196_00585 [Kitasatospora purpeofusca]
MALTARRVLQGGVVVGVVARRTGGGHVVVQALPLCEGVGSSGTGGFVTGVGVPVGSALVGPGPVEGLLDPVQGRPGVQAAKANQTGHIAEQPERSTTW